MSYILRLKLLSKQAKHIQKKFLDPISDGQPEFKIVYSLTYILQSPKATNGFSKSSPANRILIRPCIASLQFSEDRTMKFATTFSTYSKFVRLASSGESGQNNTIPN